MKVLKKQKRKISGKTTNVELGSLYDINKSIINNLPSLTQEEIQEKNAEIEDFILHTADTYYMLLCNDRKDYTIFNLKETDSFKEAIQILLEECLPNRGEIKSINLTEDKQAIEIWLFIDKESYCYYFFPYSLGVIEC